MASCLKTTAYFRSTTSSALFSSPQVGPTDKIYIMAKSRLETNFLRLLEQCKSMANNGKHTEWRFEKYVATLEQYLADLRRFPLISDKETVEEYTRAVAFLRSLNLTEKLPSAADRVVASQFLTPTSSPYGDIVSKEIHHKLAAQYTNQVREELMSVKANPADSEGKENKEEYDNPASVLRQRKAQLLSSVNVSTTPAKDFEAVMRDEQKAQEEITNDLLLLTRSLKEQSSTANMVIRKDLEALAKSNKLAEENSSNLLVQTQKLRERTGFCGRCWVWLLVILICFLFTGMVVFMRLFKKKVST